MIRLTDAALLAYTKLRARKVRLIVTVVISSLLFGVLALGSFVFRGVVNSTESFAQEGFGKRYILSAESSGGGRFSDDKTVLERAIALQKNEIARKKIEAKRIGIEYDATTERLVYQDTGGPSGKEKYLDQTHPLAVKAINEYLIAHPEPGLSELQKLSAPYGAKNFYESRYIAGDTGSSKLKVLKDGKESFEENNQQKFNPFSQGLDSFTSSWSLLSADLLKTFTLDGTVPEVSKDGVLPIVVPYSAVEQLLKLKPLPASASANARLERLKEVRARAGSVEFGVCSRNASSTDLINQALTSKRELEQNKGNKNYEKPSLIYDTPTEPCGAARIIRDIRTNDEKVMAAKWDSFRQLFGQEVPAQSILRFRVVGVAPDPPGFNAAFLDGLISSILTSNIGVNWYTPLEARKANPVLQNLFPDQQSNGRANSFYVELPTAESAKQMLDGASCDLSALSGIPGPNSEGPPPAAQITGQVDDCAKNGKPFYLLPYGSSSLAINELQKVFGKVFKIAALVVTVIAAIILMGTLGRIIADARRETAVFRAIGAKRLDIAQVYITYALVIALMIGLCAILSGFGLSQIAQSKWGAEFTIKALVAYNARDLTRQFHLYAWSSHDLLYIMLAAVSAGLISTILPLLRNLRRNPIRDMRDEN